MHPEIFKPSAPHSAPECRFNFAARRYVIIAARPLIGLAIGPPEHTAVAVRKIRQHGDKIPVQRHATRVAVLGLGKRDVCARQFGAAPVKPKGFTDSGAGKKQKYHERSKVRRASGDEPAGLVMRQLADSRRRRFRATNIPLHASEFQESRDRRVDLPVAGSI